MCAGLDDGQRAALRRLVLCLADVDDRDAVHPRRIGRDELAAHPLPTALLVDARVLTTDDDGAEASHEALLRAWPRLRDWVREDLPGLRLPGLRLHRRLTAAATGWQEAGRDEGAVYRGVRLTSAVAWASARPGELTAAEQRFLDAGLRLRDREERARRRRRVVLGLGVLLLAVLTLAVLD